MEFDSFAANPQLIEALERRSSTLPSSDGMMLFRQREPCKGLYILKTGWGRTGLAIPCRTRRHVPPCRFRLTAGPSGCGRSQAVQSLRDHS
jgi:hypothetical protein